MMFKEPHCLNYMQIQNAQDLHRQNYHDKVNMDKEMMPLVESDDLIIVGFDDIKQPWTDFNEIDDHAWNTELIKQHLNEQYETPIGFDLESLPQFE